MEYNQLFVLLSYPTIHRSTHPTSQSAQSSNVCIHLPLSKSQATPASQSSASIAQLDSLTSSTPRLFTPLTLSLCFMGSLVGNFSPKIISVPLGSMSILTTSLLVPFLSTPSFPTSRFLLIVVIMSVSDLVGTPVIDSRGSRPPYFPSLVQILILLWILPPKNLADIFFAGRLRSTSRVHMNGIRMRFAWRCLRDLIIS